MDEDPKDCPSKNAGAEWIAIGVAIGVDIGAAMDDMSMGIPVGITIGAGIMAWQRRS